MERDRHTVFNVVVTRFLVRGRNLRTSEIQTHKSNVCGRRATLATAQAERTPQDNGVVVA